MNLAIMFGAIVMAVATPGQADMKLTPEVLNGDASLSGPSLRGAAVSPDGSLVTVLRGRAEDSRQLDLWAYDIRTGAAHMLVSSTGLVKNGTAMSEEEKNRRERQRIYDNGITSYQWDEQGRQILVPLGGDVYVYDLATGAPLRVTNTEAYETDAKFSPEGGYVSYVRDDELYVYDIADKRETKITSGATTGEGGTIRNAVSEFVAQEELDRDTGYWWSPDDQYIAIAQIDEAPVPVTERLDINADNVVSVKQRYPFAGKDNVRVKLFVTDTQGDNPVEIDLGPNPDIYLARVHWSKDATMLYVERLSRDQKRLDLLEADPKTGETKIILTEQENTWVNLNQDFRTLKSGGFVWGSERSGFHQLYRYDANGGLVNEITSGPGLVKQLNCVDEAAGMVYYSGWRDSPLESQLFAVPLDGGLATRISKQDGVHGAKYSRNCHTTIRTFSNQSQPTQTGVYDDKGKFLFWLNENKLDTDHPYFRYLARHKAWEFGELQAADGTPLHFEILKPEGLKPGKKAPAIVLVYGGPHAQKVRNVWGNLFAQMLAENGYVVFQLDNRGAGNRGTAFENTLYRAMGTTEVQDQAVGARYLKSLPFVDGDHIGVYGWSYGGYMTLRMLTATPDLYAAGVAGAPVTDWSLYDTAYTERYMGKPQEEPQAYAKGSVFTDLDKLKANLLVIHGMADDNVVFQNSVKLMHALQAEGASFELMTYPGEKHGFRNKANKIHRDKLILDFFDRHLKQGQ